MKRKHRAAEKVLWLKKVDLKLMLKITPLYQVPSFLLFCFLALDYLARTVCMKFLIYKSKSKDTSDLGSRLGHVSWPLNLLKTAKFSVPMYMLGTILEFHQSF